LRYVASFVEWVDSVEACVETVAPRLDTVLVKLAMLAALVEIEVACVETVELSVLTLVFSEAIDELFVAIADE
jgi:hypothetical protein